MPYNHKHMFNLDDDYKKDVAGSDSVRKFLNMDSEQDTSAPADLPIAESVDEDFVPADLPVKDLPIVEAVAVETISESKSKKEVKTVAELFPSSDSNKDKSKKADSVQTENLSTDESIDPSEELRAGEKVFKIVKAVAPYIAIFAIGLGLYFFYFSDFSINSLFKSGSLTIENVASTKTNKDLENLEADQKTAYLAWMKQFFFEVNDDAIISMDADVSGNGLTNFEKYLLNLNPKVYSSRGSNVPDGQLVIDDISPWTGKPFTEEQKALVNKYINKENISNRITAAALTRGVTKFSQYVQQDSPYYVEPAILANSDPNQVNGNVAYVGNNGTSGSSGNSNGTLNGSQSEVQSNQTAGTVAQQIGGNTNSYNQASNLNPSTDIDQSIPGKIDIPANNISVPLTWTKDVKDFDEDLKKGTVHYPGTVLPGQIGTSYVSGHSSGYLWDNSPYKTIFAGLGAVKDGTSFSVTVTLKNGKQVRYHYVVAGRGEYKADDQAQFVNTADSVVALSTCWPVGTTARRLVLYGKLSQTEQL